jgi:hypothetical protein
MLAMGAPEPPRVATCRTCRQALTQLSRMKDYSKTSPQDILAWADRYAKRAAITLRGASELFL